jgi:nitroreductase
LRDALLLDERGLGSCMQEAWPSYRPQLALCFGLAENEMVYCGMAVGYPKLDNPVNRFPRSRISLDELVEFRGF